MQLQLDYFILQSSTTSIEMYIPILPCYNSKLKKSLYFNEMQLFGMAVSMRVATIN